jgi:hypothetical protein
MRATIEEAIADGVAIKKALPWKAGVGVPP